MNQFKVLFFINFTGIFWLIGGYFLFLKGFNYLVLSTVTPIYFTILVSGSLILGTIKNRYVFTKVVKKVVDRIKSPVPIYRIYERRFYILIALMIAISKCLNAIFLPYFIKGFIDLVIAVALMQGAFQYFKIGFSHLKKHYL